MVDAVLNLRMVAAVLVAAVLVAAGVALVTGGTANTPHPLPPLTDRPSTRAQSVVRVS